MEHTNNVQTFEQVNAQVEKYFEKQTGGLKATKVDLFTVWTIARPILSLVASLGILPSKWRSIISDLITAIDAVVATKF